MRQKNPENKSVGDVPLVKGNNPIKIEFPIEEKEVEEYLHGKNI